MNKILATLFCLIVIEFVAQERNLPDTIEQVSTRQSQVRQVISGEDSLQGNYFPQFKPAFFIGGGVQLVYNASDEKSSLNYTKAGSGWIGLALTKGRKQFCFRIRSSYREANIYAQNGSLGSGTQYHGHLSFIKIDAGLGVLKSFGKKNNFFIGIGGFMGGTTSATGNIQGYAWGKNAVPIENPGPFLLLNSFHAGSYLDMHQQVKINQQHRILIGITAQIETRESSWVYRSGKFIDLYLAYKFYKK